MYILQKSLKTLNSSISVDRSMVSLNQNSVSSSTGYSEEATAYLVSGDINGTFGSYAILNFPTHNDIYVSDDLVMDNDDVQYIWQQGVDFLEEMGFYMDNISFEDLIITPVFDATLFADEKLSNILEESSIDPSLTVDSIPNNLTDLEKDEIIKYLSFF